MFTHLHCHTEFSIRDALTKVSQLVERVKELKMSAVAVTDHGNMACALEFYLECQKNGIVPIIGMEAYIVPDIQIKEKEKRYHMVLLAQNNEGYKNLIQLASIAGTDGFYYVPRLDLKTISNYRNGLIALTACSISSIVYMSGEKGEKRMAKLLQRIFGENLYLEVMPHVMKEQREHNLLMFNLSEDLGIPLVVTQDVHYLNKEDKEAHDVLMKIQGREPYNCDTLFLGDSVEIMKIFYEEHKYLSVSEVEKALANTDVIAQSIEEYEIPIGKFIFPSFHHQKEK